ncbi:MAG: S-layer homology domain-containing protein [Candidatus Peribacteraceae bacterium]
MKNISIITIAFALLAWFVPANAAMEKEYCDSTVGYCLDLPQDFANSSWKPAISANGKEATHVASNGLHTDDAEALYIAVYHNQGVCNYTYLGNFQEEMTYLSEVGDKTQWAFVPIFNYNDWFPDAVCPAARGECTDKEYSLGTCVTDAATYAFCSQKDDKVVFICLEQQKNNLELAEQIFSTFRWTEEEEEQTPAIQYLLDNNIASGYPDGTFRPENSINRAEFTKIIVGATHEKDQIGECIMLSSVTPFPDVAVEDWFMPYTCTARRFGIMDGYPDGSFKPAQNVNTAEAAKIVVGAFELETEAGNYENWYTPYVNALHSLDALPASTQDPAHLLTRGEMAEIIYRVRTNAPAEKSQTNETSNRISTGNTASLPFTFPMDASWEEEWNFYQKTNPEWTEENSEPLTIEPDMSRVEYKEESSADFSNVLRVHYPAGSASPFIAHYYDKPLGGVSSIVTGDINPQDRLVLRYYVRVPEDFDFVRGGTLPGIMGGLTNAQYGSMGASYMYVKPTWDDRGTIGVLGNFDDNDRSRGLLSSYATLEADGAWHEVVLDATLNTVPSSRMNGRLDVYYDGERIITDDAIRFRTSTEHQWEGMNFTSCFGGLSMASVTPKDQYIDFAGFTLNNRSF